jgi:3-deoxy-D-manno-octulosonic-acid transferase
LPDRAAAPAPTGPLLAAALAARHLAAPFAPLLLRRRLAAGREDPARWREKLGQAMAPRPDGPLVWLHAVGLGEVLALRGLIAAMAAQRGDLAFLVTSTARASARAFAGQAPPRTRHQFLPLDLPRPARRFLDHWRPALSVWAEQDLWPGLVVDTHRRGIPLALVNGRMDGRAFAARRRARGLFADLYARFALIAAQDAATAGHLAALGARDVAVTGSLKPGAGALACDPAELARLAALLAGRRVWLAAATHAGDEAVALPAQAALAAADPGRLLILAPRDPARAPAIAAAAAAHGLPVARRSRGEPPERGIYLADTYGEMGLWYRLAGAALVGGGFGIGGHNPWEAAALGCPVLHGPGTANFADDYARLHAAGAARPVADAAALAAALADPGLAAMAARAAGLAAAAAAGTRALAADLLGLLR